MKRWWIVIPYLVYFVAMNWPVLWWVNRIEPRIGAVPFLVCWMIAWSLLIGVVHVGVALFVWRDPQLPEEKGGEAS